MPSLALNCVVACEIICKSLWVEWKCISIDWESQVTIEKKKLILLNYLRVERRVGVVHCNKKKCVVSEEEKNFLFSSVHGVCLKSKGGDGQLVSEKCGPKWASPLTLTLVSTWTSTTLHSASLLLLLLFLLHLSSCVCMCACECMCSLTLSWKVFSPLNQ